MAQYPATISLASLSGDDGFAVTGGGPSFGFSVALAGDVNGDGFSDLVFGAPDTSYGVAHVLFGQAGGFGASVSVASLDGSNGFTLAPGSAGAAAGYSVAAAGDVNGDGFADIIVGAPRGSANAQYAGASYIVFGHAGGFAATLGDADIDGVNGFRLDGVAGGEHSGHSVASAGDFNGDGYDDLVVGAPNASPNGGASGSAYVVFGKAGGVDPTVDVSSLDGSDGFRIDGVAGFDHAGIAVASAGDVNGDGLDDLIIGAPVAGGRGAAYVVFGQSTPMAATFDLASLDGTNGFALVGGAAGDHAGGSVANVGDINGDGLADLAVGAYGANGYAGSTYVIFGKAAGFAASTDLGGLDGHNGFRVDGSGFSGSHVSAAGDVNGDGFADLIFSAPFGGAGGRGFAYVVFGKAGGFDPSISVDDLDGSNGFRLDGPGAGSQTGSSVAAAGDLNGDGLGDIMVGAAGADTAYVVYGRLPDTAVTRIGTVASQTLVGGEFADNLSGGGGDDVLWGHDGANTLSGGDGHDTLLGGGGADRLNGGDGVDSMVGGAGDDLYFTDNPLDLIVETTDHGRDTIATCYSLTLLDSQSIESLRAWDTTDSLALTGNAFANRLAGGVGDDTLQGGGGADVLIGGAGADHFVFAAAGDSATTARDRILDFAQGSDVIDLHAIDADPTRSGDQAFHLAAANHFHGEAGEMLIRHAGANTVVLADIDGDREADLVIVVRGDLALTTADFVL